MTILSQAPTDFVNRLEKKETEKPPLQASENRMEQKALEILKENELYITVTHDSLTVFARPELYDVPSSNPRVQEIIDAVEYLARHHAVVKGNPVFLSNPGTQVSDDLPMGRSMITCMEQSPNHYPSKLAFFLQDHGINYQGSCKRINKL